MPKSALEVDDERKRFGSSKTAIPAPSLLKQ
jgi:hypothetical protein